MRKTTVFWISAVLLLCLLTACGGEATPSPISTTEVPPTNTPIATEPPTEVPPELIIAPEPVSITEILDTTWQWAALVETVPANQSIVSEPEGYSLVLWQDNNFNFLADCNVGSGMYSTVGSNLNLEMGPSTLAECGGDSLHDQYLELLGSVSEFGLQDNMLVLGLGENSGYMVFNNGGPAQPPEQQADSCSGVLMRTVTIDTMGLPYSWRSNCLPPTAYDNSQPSRPTGLPAHLQINFGVTNPEHKQYGDPILYVIPIIEYEQLWASNGDQSVVDTMDNLEKLLQDKPVPIPANGLPVLPYEEVSGVNDLAVQGEYLDVTMGEGVRFVGRFSQDSNPVTNDNPPLFYIYQGFTGDGNYLISFFYPVSTSVLPGSDEVTSEEQQLVDSDPEAYLEAKTTELNAIAPSDWEPDLETLDAVIDSLIFASDYIPPEPVPSPEPVLTNIYWQWAELTEPDGQSVVPDPENYILLFLTNGRFNFTADCNSGDGTYELNGNNLIMNVGAVTEADCGRDSLSNQFTVLLGDVAAYDLAIDKLVLNFSEDAGSMGFISGGPLIDIPVPEEGTPVATTIEPLNVRSGPGTLYPSFSTVPRGTTFEVTGISENGFWWVVKIPTFVAPSGNGWINANYVETENTENMPIVPAPPLEGVVLPPPEPGAPTATTIEPINVRRGPGTEYISYGTVPKGTTFVVVGVSPDGAWWVVRIPADIAENEQGWVAARYVETSNTDNMPIIQPP